MLVSRAETTTSDNLLTNGTFDENTNGWILSDSNVKRDANSYSNAGNTPTVRFKGQTSTITQSVNLNALETGKQITGLTIKLNGYGCGNNDYGHCTKKNHDTIVTNITLQTENNGAVEISNNVFTVPYEDGWTAHTATKSIINDTFLTGETSITFSLQGIDTGNSSSWLGPISDNYQLLVTYQDYIVQQAVQEVIAQEVVNNIIGGLNLDTSITNDIILDQPMHTIDIELPNMDMGNIEMDMEMDMGNMNMDMDMGNTEMDMPVNMQIEMPINIPTVEIRLTDIPPQIEATQEIQEIREMPEIKMEEPLELEMEPEMAEIESPEELSTEDTHDQDVKENSTDEPEQVAEQEAEPESKGDDDSNLSNGGKNESKTKEEKSSSKKKNSKKTNTKKETTKEKTVVKSVAKVNKEPVDKVTKPSTNADTLGQISITSMVYLQMIPQTITIQETVVLTQEMIYEQDIGAFTSSDTYDSLISSSNSRWVRMVDVRPKHTFSGYGR